MMNKAFMSAGAAALIGAIGGGVFVVASPSGAADLAVSWRAPPLPPAPHTGDESLAAKLLATGHFRQNLASRAEADAAAEPEKLPPPRVVAVSARAGAIEITVMTAAGDIVSAAVGDVIDGAWTITRVSEALDAVTMTREQETQTVPLFAASGR